MPASRQVRTAHQARCHAGDRPKPTRPRNSKSKSCCTSGQASPGVVDHALRTRHGQHPHALRSQGFHLCPPRHAIGWRQMAQVHHRLGPLGRDHVAHAAGLVPRATWPATPGRKGAGTSQLPVGVQMHLFRRPTKWCEAVSPKAFSIGSTGRAGTPASHIRARGERLLASRLAPRRQCRLRCPCATTRCAMVMLFCVSVPVLSVHNTVAVPKASDGRRAAHQHTVLRHAPRPMAMNTLMIREILAAAVT